MQDTSQNRKRLKRNFSANKYEFPENESFITIKNVFQIHFGMEKWGIISFFQ